MKYFFSILLLCTSIFAKSQTYGTVTEQAVSGAGNLVYFIPTGANTADSLHKLVFVHRPGVGATNFTNIKIEEPFLSLSNGSWDGKFVDRFGDTVYCIFLSSYTNSDGCNDLIRHLNFGVANWLTVIDTGALKRNRRFVMTGYSQGGQDISKALTTFCRDWIGYNTDVYRFMFKKIGTAETGDWQFLNELRNLNNPLSYWGWHDNTTPTNTFPASTQAVYDSIAAGNPGRPYSVKIKLYDVTHGTGDDSFYRRPQSYDNASTNFIKWAHDTADVPPPLQKITGIHHRDILQMTGQGLTFDAKTMFDEQGADPDNGVSTPTPSNSNISFNPIHFSSYLNEEHRYAVDLRGQYRLRKIYVYAANSFFDDSVVFYKGHFKGEPDTAWKRIGAIRIAAGATGWLSITLPGTDTSALLGVGHKGTWEPLYGKNGIADAREIIVYGDLIGSRSPAPASFPYTGAYRPRPTMYKLLAGTNHQIGKVKNYYIRGKSGHRQGLQTEWFESAGGLLDYPTNTYDFNVFGAYPTNQATMERYVADSIVTHLRQLYFTFLIHSNTRYRNQGGPEEGHMVNNFGNNPYKFASYTRVGNYHWMRAALYGFTLVDTNLIRMTGIPKYSRLRLMRFHENGNEVDKFWGGPDTASSATQTKLFISPLSYVTQSQMDYDGYEGRYGPYIGVKAADDSTELLEAGIVGPDTALMESRVRISQLQRNDGKDIFKTAFNIHYYPNNGVTGIPAAKDSVHVKMNLVTDYLYRVNPLKEVWVTESNYDANTGSIYGIIHSDSYTDRQTQATNNLWLKINYARTRVDRLFIYNFAWNALEGNAGGYQTSQELKLFPSEEPQTYHYVGFQFDSLLAAYQYHSTTQFGWQVVNIDRFVSATHADSVIYTVGLPNTTGMSTSASVYVGMNKVVKKYVLSWNTYVPAVSIPAYNPTTGLITDTFDNRPYMYVVTSLPSGTGTDKSKRRMILNR